MGFFFWAALNEREADDRILFFLWDMARDSCFSLTVLEKKNILLCSLLVTLKLLWVVVKTIQVCVELSGMFPFVPWDAKKCSYSFDYVSSSL